MSDGAHQTSQRSFSVDKARIEPLWNMLVQASRDQGTLNSTESEPRIKASFMRYLMKAFEGNSLTLQETRWIFDQADSFTFDQFFDLVSDVGDASFDPISAAFDLVQKNGQVDLEKITVAFEALGVEGASAPVVKMVANKLLQSMPDVSKKDKAGSRIDRESFGSLCSLSVNTTDDHEDNLMFGRASELPQ
eukprot:TRINITY_DN16613_c0_g1_i1.p1 TRINITY_DN16613_c0_g1~~TRINITY_DN16613_c0_g1_i1.p1  ORF type:complete len:191 (+),score=33.71 TRINITY_DN16613_c0_g1_i1:60-632(+)